MEHEEVSGEEGAGFGVFMAMRGAASDGEGGSVGGEAEAVEGELGEAVGARMTERDGPA